VQFPAHTFPSCNFSGLCAEPQGVIGRVRKSVCAIYLYTEYLRALLDGGAILAA
jgi:hypothetical protein